MQLYFSLLLSFMALTSTATASTSEKPLKALVWRGHDDTSCDGCPESAAALLKSSPTKIDVSFVGPDEDTKLTADALKNVNIYVQPGGGDLDEAWVQMKQYKTIIQDFVNNGGRYLGFCLGAYLGGYSPGFGLLDRGSDTDAENVQPGTQVPGTEDTIIQVDWTFRDGHTDMKRWMYFQEGAVIKLAKNSTAKVLGRYSSNGNVAATLNAYGKGWVGLVGPHPEADESWYQSYNLSNPDGVRFDIGHDFVETVVNAGKQLPVTSGANRKFALPCCCIS